MNNSENIKTIYVAVDKTAPLVGATTLTGFNIYTNYINGTGTIVGGVATDSPSGIDTTTCKYTLNNGVDWANANWNTDHCEKSNVDIANDKTYTITTQVRDVASNIFSGTSTQTYTGDTLAPTTTDNSDTTWHGEDINIILTPTDTGSGVKSTYYCIDTTNTCLPETTGTIVELTCPQESICLKYVRYYSIDNLNNTEEIKSSNQVKIDKDIPSIGQTITEGFLIYNSFIKGSGKVKSGAVTDESGSGVDNPQYTTNNGLTWADANFIISDTNYVESGEITILDGNDYAFNTRIRDVGSGRTASGISTIQYTGDLSSPTTTASWPIDFNTKNILADYNLSLICNDDLSGCKNTYYQLDSDVWVSGDIITLSATQTHTINYYSIDNLDNNEATTNINDLILIGGVDTDEDGNSDATDPLWYTENEVNTEGINNLVISVGGEPTSHLFFGEQEILFKENDINLLSFYHNFDANTFDLSKVIIEKTANSILVDLNGQLQIDYNKILYLTNNNFVSLCVKNALVTSISQISSSCNGVDEYNFTNCLKGNYSIAGINCTLSNGIIKVDNLRYSAILGTLSSASTSGSCNPFWSCTKWSVCDGNNQTRTCTKINNCGTALLGKPIESKTCSIIVPEIDDEILTDDEIVTNDDNQNNTNIDANVNSSVDQNKTNDLNNSVGNNENENNSSLLFEMTLGGGIILIILILLIIFFIAKKKKEK